MTQRSNVSRLLWRMISLASTRSSAGVSAWPGGYQAERDFPSARQSKTVRSEPSSAPRERDGYLLYGTPDRRAGAVGPRDRLPKLAGNYKLPSNQEANAISCFAILPEFRGKGLANFLLGEMVKDLAERGVKRLEAYPRRGEQLEAEEVWTGPELIFLQAGFQVE